MKSHIDSTSNEGALSYEWLQLLLFGAMAFLGWFLCSQAFDQISKRRKPKKEVESPKVDDSDSFGKVVASYAAEHSVKSTMKHFRLTRAQVQKYAESFEISNVDVTSEEELEPQLAEEPVADEGITETEEDSAKKRKKKQRSKKVQKAAEESENEAQAEVPEVPELHEEIACAIVCARDFETSSSESEAWIATNRKRRKEQSKPVEEKFNWYEESKDMEPTFIKASKIPGEKHASKPTLQANEKVKDAMDEHQGQMMWVGDISIEVTDDFKLEQPLPSQHAAAQHDSGKKEIAKEDASQSTCPPIAKGNAKGAKLQKGKEENAKEDASQSTGAPVAKGNAKGAKLEKGKSSGKGAKSKKETEPSTKESKIQVEEPMVEEPKEKPQKGKSSGKGAKSKKETEPNAKVSKMQVEEPKAEAPKSEAPQSEAPKAEPPLAVWEGVTWAERMRLLNPLAEQEEAVLEPNAQASKGHSIAQQQPPADEKAERPQRKKRQRRQEEPSVATKPVVVPPPVKKVSGAPAWEWDMSDGCSAEPVQHQGAPGWQWDESDQTSQVVPPAPVKIPGVAPGWQWDTNEEFPHPDPNTGSMPVVVPPRRQENRSMMLGIVVNWGSKGFGFLGDQTGSRFYAKQEVVRNGGKLRIGSFVWFRLYENNDTRVAEIAKLEEHHEWNVKKAINDGIAWCRLRCEIDGDMTVLSEEEAGFPGMFHGQFARTDDLNWDVDLIEVANEAKAALNEQAGVAVPAWLDSAYMASTGAPEYISAAPLHGATDDFWTHYNTEAESTEQWDMIPLNSEVPYEGSYEDQPLYEGSYEDQPHVDEPAVLCEDLKPNLGAYLDESDTDEVQ
jgi:hypothetical protein